MSKPLAITDVVLRDAHQSLFATRMRIEDMLPIAAELDKIGSVTGRWKLGVERRLMLASVSLAKIHGNVYAL